MLAPTDELHGYNGDNRSENSSKVVPAKDRPYSVDRLQPETPKNKREQPETVHLLKDNHIDNDRSSVYPLPDEEDNTLSLSQLTSVVATPSAVAAASATAEQSAPPSSSSCEYPSYVDRSSNSFGTQSTDRKYLVDNEPEVAEISSGTIPCDVNKCIRDVETLSSYVEKLTSWTTRCLQCDNGCDEDSGVERAATGEAIRSSRDGVCHDHIAQEKLL